MILSSHPPHNDAIGRRRRSTNEIMRGGIVFEKVTKNVMDF